MDEVNFENPYCTFLTMQKIRAPKILGDVWESVAGAVFLDGGWKAIHQVYGKVLTPFMLCFVQNEKFFLLDLNQDLHELAVIL